MSLVFLSVSVPFFPARRPEWLLRYVPLRLCAFVTHNHRIFFSYDRRHYKKHAACNSWFIKYLTPGIITRRFQFRIALVAPFSN